MKLRLFGYAILCGGLVILLYLGIRADFTLLTAQYRSTTALPRARQIDVQAEPTAVPGAAQVKAGTPVEVAENPLLPLERYQATHSITDPAIIVTDTVTGDVVLLGEDRVVLSGKGRVMHICSGYSVVVPVVPPWSLASMPTPLQLNKIFNCYLLHYPWARHWSMVTGWFT